ncbi:MAG: helix-turn-helix domain-containing protein [Acidimicrobiales bacterium]
MQQQWIVRSAEDFGRGIAEVRRGQDLTQHELAEQGGISRHWLAKLEAGHSTPVLEHLLRLTRRLGITITLTWDGDDGQA